MIRNPMQELMALLDGAVEQPPAVYMPGSNLPRLLTQVVDRVTTAFPEETWGIETELACRDGGCDGRIIGGLQEVDEPIHWYCTECGDNGAITNWQGSPWDHTSGEASREESPDARE
jgi:hypothetical protein